jgi:hypothetical protein
MDRPRDVLRIATFQPQSLRRREECPQAGPLRASADSDNNVALLRPDFRPQAVDHPGNFFRLPPHSTADQHDAVSLQGPIDLGLRIVALPQAASDAILRLRQDLRVSVLTGSAALAPSDPVISQVVTESPMK